MSNLIDLNKCFPKDRNFMKVKTHGMKVLTLQNSEEKNEEKKEDMKEDHIFLLVTGFDWALL